MHGFPDMKIHAKMTLVVRREPGGLRRYVHIGTGNYHAATARLYEDVGIFTADEEIAADVADVFNYVTGFGRPQRFRKLLVAPFEMRDTAAGGDRSGAPPPRRTNRHDPPQAQQPRRSEGDRRPLRSCRRRCPRGDLRALDLHVRPGVEGLSETSHVRSILGRFLEHSRIYAFEVARRPRCSSAAPT